MNSFIFIGPPGAGKGTQSALLQERLGFTHISTGSLVRKEIESGTKFGQSIKDIVESGHYVDDESIVQCLKNHLKHLDEKEKNVILLDGIPRNINQANILEEIFGDNLKGVVAFIADLDKLIVRFVKRWMCKNCGRVVSFDNGPPPDYECLSCHVKGKFTRRKDDEAHVIRERRQVYMEQTALLFEFYRNRGILYEFDALQPIERLYVEVAGLILQKVYGKC